MSPADKNTDGFFKNLLSGEGLEKAPEGFADRVMQAVEAEKSMVKESLWSWSGWWLWGSIAFALGCLVVVLFFVDFSFMGSVFQGIVVDEALLSRITGEIGKELLGMKEGLSFSPTTIYIFVAIAALFVIERVFRRKPKMEMHVI